MSDAVVFEFRADIANAVSDVKAGTTQIINDLQEVATAAGNFGDFRKLGRSLSEVNTLADTTGDNLRRIFEEFSTGSLKGKDLTVALRNELAQLDRNLGRLGGKQGISLDVTLKIREGVVKETTKLVESLAQKALDAGAKAVHVGSKRIYTVGENNVVTGFDQGQEDRGKASPQARARQRSATARAAAEARAAAATGDAAEIAEQDARDARSAGRDLRRARINRVASEIEAAKNAQAASQAAAKAAVAPVGPDPAAAAPALKRKQVITPATRPTGPDGSRDQLLAAAEAAVTAKLGGASFESMAELKAFEDRVTAEFLRGGDTPNKDRRNGYAPGVFKAGKYLQDTRFGQTDLYQENARGAVDLITDLEEFRRAQEAFGAAMAKDTEATFTAAERAKALARQKQTENLQKSEGIRLRQGAKPGERFGKDIYDLGGGLVSDQSQGRLDFLQQVGSKLENRFQRIIAGSGASLDATKKYIDGLEKIYNPKGLTRAQQDLATQQNRSVVGPEARLQNTERIKGGAQDGQRFAPGVVEISDTEAVDTRGLRGRGLEYYKRANDGLFDLITAQDKLDLAERKYGEVLNKAANEVYAAGQVRQRQNNFENLRQGAGLGKLFTDNVQDLGGGYVADLRGKVAEFYKKAGIGFERLGEYSYDHTVALGKLLNAQSKAEADEVARSNASRLYDPSRRSGLIEGVNAVQYSATGITTVEDGVRKFYKVMADGLHELTANSQQYNEQLTKFERSGAGGRGPLGSFVHGLTSGGIGGNGVDGIDGALQAAGTTVKYTALYGALGALQGLLARVGAEMVNFADSNTDLNIAIDQVTDSTEQATGVNSAYVTSLEQISITAGSNVGDIQDIVAAGIRTIGLESGHSKEEVQQLGEEFAQQAQRMAILGKTDIKDAAGNIRAISTAYNIPLQDTARINDALVTGKNVGGGDEKQTAQAVASAGEAAKAAGISLEALATIASRIQASTDQTGAAVGNKISRILSTAGGTAGQKALADLNSTLAPGKQIDLTANIGTQLQQLSAARADLSEAQVKAVANTIGGTSSYKEFLTILTDYNDLLNNNGKGLNNAGVAAREYQERLGDLSVTVREFQGAISAIIVNIGTSGALDDVIIAFKAIVALLKETAHLTGVFNTLSGDTGKWVLRLGEAAVALSLLGKVIRAGGFGEFLASTERTFRPQSYEARQRIKASDVVGETVKDGALTVPVLNTSSIQKVYDEGAVRIKQGADVVANEAIPKLVAAETKAVAELVEVESNVLAHVNAAAAASAKRAGVIIADAGVTAGTEAAAASSIAARNAASEVAAAVITAGEAAAAAAALAASNASAKAAAAGLTVAEAQTLAASKKFDAGIAGLVGEKEPGLARQRYEQGLAGAAGASRRGEGGLFIRAGQRIDAGATRFAASRAGGLIEKAGVGLAGLAESLINPVSLAIGGFIAIGALKSKSDEVSAGMRQANRDFKDFADLANQTQGLDASQVVEIYRNKASKYESNAEAQDKRLNSGLGGFFRSDESKGQVQGQKALALFATNQADLIESSSKNIAPQLQNLALFGDPATRTMENISSAMQTLKANGVSAEERLKLFNIALGQTGVAASAAAKKPQIAADLATDLSGIGKNFNYDITQPNPGGAAGFQRVKNPLNTYFQKNATDIATLVRDNLPDNPEGAFGSYSTDQVNSIGDLVANKVKDDYISVYKAMSPIDQAKTENKPQTIFDIAKAKTIDFLIGQGNVTGQTPVGIKTTAKDAFQQITGTGGVNDTYADRLGKVGAGDNPGRLKVLSQQYSEISAKIANVKPGEDVTALLEEQQKVATEIADSALADEEATRKGLQRKATTDAEVKRIGNEAFSQEVSSAIQSGSVDVLIEVLNRGSKRQLDIAKQVVQDNIKIDKAIIEKIKSDTRMQVLIEKYGGNVDPVTQGADFDRDVKAAQDEALKGQAGAAAQADLDRNTGLLGAFDQANPTGSINTNGGEGPLAQEELDITRRNAQRVGGAKLADARQKVKDDRTLLAATKEYYGRTSKEYWEAFAQLQQDKVDLVDIEADAANNRALAKIDTTDPAAVARQARIDSQKRLADAEKRADAKRDKDGKLTPLKGDEREDFLAPFKEDLATKKSDEENTAVDEYISDLKTSLDLHRISTKLFLEGVRAKRDLLQAEYNSLDKDAKGQKARKKKIDELTGLLKDTAKELNGQFNLGDITIPTIYQVRRSIKARTAGEVLGSNGSFSTAGNVTNDSSTRNVILNGVPIETILTLIQDMFGVKARTTAARRARS